MNDSTVKNDAVAAAGSAGLDCFPMTGMKKAINGASEAKSKEAHANGLRVSHSMVMCNLAFAFANECATKTEDHGLVMGDWRDNWKLILKVYAAKKHAFVEFTASKKDGEPAIPKWNTTANNAISTAKGVLDFRLDPESCLNEKGENTWTAVQKEVQKLRKARKDEDNPEQALLAIAKQDAKDAFGKLTEVIFGTGDIGLIEVLTAKLVAMRTQSVDDIAEQVKIDAIAVAEKAATSAAELAASVAADLAAIEESDSEENEEATPVAEAA